MKRVYIGIGVAAVLLIVVFSLPASLFSTFLHDYGIHLLQTQGTIWSGSGQPVVRGRSLNRLNWKLEPRRLIQGRFVFNVSLDDPAIAVDGELSAGFSKSTIAANVRLEPSLVNAVLLNYDIEIAGEFMFNDLNLQVTHSGTVSSLSGTIHWTGGLSRYRIGDVARIIEMPPLSGVLSVQEGEPILTAIDEQTESMLVTARLEPGTGWIHVEVTKQMLEMVEMAWDSDASQETVIFKVSQQLY